MKKAPIEKSVVDLTKMIRAAFASDALKGMADDEKRDASAYKIFPIEIIVKADWNYKENNDFTGEKLRNNLKRIGQVENCQVRLLKTGYYEMVNGNHRLDEMNAIGKKFIICYDHGAITDSEARRIAIETNETRFPSNRNLLYELIGSVVEDQGYENIIDTMPFTEDEIDAMLGTPDVVEEEKEVKPTTKKVFYLNIECDDEEHASELYERFSSEGLKTKIIS